MSKPLRVLIVEDRISDTELALYELRQAGYTLDWQVVETEADYLAALEKPWDVILSDFKMPQFDGIRALGLLNEKGLDIPFILVSGTIGEDQAVACIKQGAADYLLKDRLMRLGPAVQHAIETRQMRAEQRRAHQALLESEERYRTLIEASPDAIVLTDFQGKVLMTNRRAVLMIGAESQEELIGANGYDFLVPEERELAREISGQLLSSQDSITMQYTIVKLDGTPHPVELSGTVFKDSDGNAQAFLSLIRDITPRKQREREREAIARVATAMRSASRREEMLPLILEEVMALLQAGSVSYMAPDPLTGEMVVELAMGGWAASTGMRMPPGEGLGSHVIASGKAYYSDDVRNDPHVDPQRVVGDLHAVAGVPLIARDQSIGVLWAARSQPFKRYEVQVLSAIADISANAIHRAALYEQTEQRLRRLAALRDIDLAIASSLDLSIILNILLEQVTAHLSVDAADVLLLDPYSQTLKCAAWRGFRSHAIAQTRLRLGEGNAGRAALEREIVSADLSTGKDSLARAPFLAGEGFAGYYAVPLLVKGQVKGVLEVFHRSGLQRDPEWLEFLETLAGQAAIAIDDAEMFENLQRSNLELAIAYDETITGWSRTLELRDMETEGHSRRVTELTMRLARAMGISDGELVHVRRGALLHDIGKMGIPDEILRKPGPLDEDEWQIMRQHPLYAYNLLAPINFLRPALEIPYCHHEKWDGTGYPGVLAGEQIPLAARIFAVVDVWDALLSARPYRDPWAEEKVVAYLKEQAGSHFDPQVVEAFLRLLPEIGPSFSSRS